MSEENRLDLVALGEPLIVLVPERAGPLRSAPSFRRSLAGAECNVARGLVRLGGSAGLIARTGADEFGAFVSEELDACGVHTAAMRRVTDRTTGVYFRQLAGPDSAASLFYYRAHSAASAMGPSDVDTDYLTNARAFLTTGITALLSETAMSAAKFALRTARESGVITIFDPNLRPGLWGSERAGQLLVPLLEDVDIFLGGEEETRQLFGCDDSLEDLADRVRTAGPSEVVLKRGADGAYALTLQGGFYEPARPITVRDPVGAGDAFNAGYLYLRQRGASPTAALTAGTVCGAAVCSAIGDFEHFPNAEQFHASVVNSDHRPELPHLVPVRVRVDQNGATCD